MKRIIAKEDMYLYDGTTIAKEVALPDDADETLWKEVTLEEATKALEEKRKALMEANTEVFATTIEDTNIVPDAE